MNYNLISLVMNLQRITIQRGVSSMHLVIYLGREKLQIYLRKMVQDTGKKYILPLEILKFMERSANPNYSIDLGHILYRNIRFHIVNKTTLKQSDSE